MNESLSVKQLRIHCHQSTMAAVAAPSPIKDHVRLFQDANDPVTRKVLVKYYLDRPGYDLTHSSARIWNDPPETCNAPDIAEFLDQQGINSIGDETMLVEVFLDRYKAYMLLESCDANKVMFDFSNTTSTDPGVITIRLTDLVSGEAKIEPPTRTVGATFCTTSPVGLFAFSMTVILDVADLFGKLVPGTVDPSFILIWGPYAFFVSGLLQFVVGMFAVARNDVYGATAFMAFGSFWLANSTKLILIAYFPEQIPTEFLAGSDPVGGFIRNFYIFGFVCVLFKQTLNINKLSSILIAGLMVQMIATSVAGWSLACQWIQLFASTFVSLWAFFAFAIEFTNEVYHKEVFNVWPWHEPTADQAFGPVFSAPGRSNTLYSHAARLRLAARTTAPTSTPLSLRMAQPSSQETMMEEIRSQCRSCEN